MLSLARNAFASSSRLPPLTASFFQCRSVQYDAAGRLAGITSRPELPTTLYLGKIPNFWGDAAIRQKLEKYSIHVKETFVPHPKTADGKRRANSRRFAFVEVETEECARKALAISPEKLGFNISLSRQSIEEAQSYADWAFDPEVRRRIAESKRPLKEWEVVEQKKKEMNERSQNKWD